LIDITPDDKQMIRDILKMPRLTTKQQADIDKEKEAQAVVEEKKVKEQNPKVEVDNLKIINDMFKIQL
jgi:hypothetical protein